MGILSHSSSSKLGPSSIWSSAKASTTTSSTLYSKPPKILTEESALHLLVAAISNRASYPHLFASFALFLLSFIIPYSTPSSSTSSTPYFSFGYRRNSNDGRSVGILLPFALINLTTTRHSYAANLLLCTSLTALLLPFNFFLTILVTSITSCCLFFTVTNDLLSVLLLSFTGALVPATAAFILYCAPDSFTSSEVSLVSCGVSILTHQLLYHDEQQLTLSVPISAGYMAALLSFATSLISCRLKKRKRTRAFIPYLIAFAAILPTYTWTYFLLNSEPVSWLLQNFIFASYRNTLLIVYWAFILLIGLTIFHPSKFVYQYGRTSSRKIFHLYAILIYVPAIYYSHPQISGASGISEFLIFAALLSFSILCILDSLPFINPFEQNLLDSRDTSSIALTHLYLLVGITAPITISSGAINIGKYAGIISLGIMDSVAAIVGSKYGKLQWKNGFGRTVEGTLASIACMLLVLAAVQQLTLVNSAAVVMVGLLEAHSSEIDNIVLPLYFLAVINA